MSEASRAPVSSQSLWYTLQTFSNNEAKVKRAIERAMATDDAVRGSIEQVEENENKVLPKVSFAVGERVKITDGPMMNLSGTVDSTDADHGKLQVSVDIFGRPTPVELEFWQVERDDRS